MKGLLLRELLFIGRNPSAWLYGLLLFILAGFVLVLAIGNAPSVLRSCGLGVLWAMIVIIMGFQGNHQFTRDAEEGVLDTLLAHGQSLVNLVLIRWISGWVMTGLPCLVVLPVLGLFFYQEGCIWWGEVGLRFFLGSLLVSLLVTTGASLTFGAARFHFLAFFLTAPLLIPILIGVTLPLKTALMLKLMGCSLLLLIPLCVSAAAYALAFQGKR